jgi:hypothetical protein
MRRKRFNGHWKIMLDIALIVNTVSKNSDLWKLFFGQLERHLGGEFKKYVFVDEGNDDIPSDCETILYDKEQIFQEQFSSCIAKVPEKYCIYISEDYILYEDVRLDLIEEYHKVMERHPVLSFIRFVRGGVIDMGMSNYRHYNDLYELSTALPYFYTGQVALWRTRDLEKIHVEGPKLHIGNNDWENSFEYQATKVCQDLHLKGLYCYHGEPKRGIYHYDTIVFPHICTALVKGQWNMAEYKMELTPLLDDYKIDTIPRGEYNANP